jgi:hypothetical protein
MDAAADASANAPDGGCGSMACPRCPVGTTCISDGVDEYAAVCLPTCSTDDDCPPGGMCFLLYPPYYNFPPVCVSRDTRELCTPLTFSCLGFPPRCSDGGALEVFFDDGHACGFERVRCNGGCASIGDAGFPFAVGQCE